MTVNLTTDELGFQEVGGAMSATGQQLAWTKPLQDRCFTFRILRTLEELGPTEPLQQEVMGCTDLDMTSANEMVVVAETGGEVIGVFGEGSEAGTLIGMSLWWGGYVNRKPRVLSDLMVVRADQRSFGIGTELKKLQAALALERGFEEIVWTVDPLRAANARLNVEKLGATSNTYEINRYGEGYGVGLYGGMPTDRLHMSWQIGSERVRERLLNPPPPADPAIMTGVPAYSLAGGNPDRVQVGLPDDIDALLASDPEAARRWRFAMRELLQSAFAAGFEITGFVPRSRPDEAVSSFVLDRRVKV